MCPVCVTGAADEAADKSTLRSVTSFPAFERVELDDGRRRLRADEGSLTRGELWRGSLILRWM
jgi:hypothetical protein